MPFVGKPRGARVNDGAFLCDSSAFSRGERTTPCPLTSCQQLDSFWFASLVHTSFERADVELLLPPRLGYSPRPREMNFLRACFGRGVTRRSLMIRNRMVGQVDGLEVGLEQASQWYEVIVKISIGK